ncbi:MAG: polysaccharide deacetylase family protein [Bacillaceae bacterium]
MKRRQIKVIEISIVALFVVLLGIYGARAYVIDVDEKEKKKAAVKKEEKSETTEDKKKGNLAKEKPAELINLQSGEKKEAPVKEKPVELVEYNGVIEHIFVHPLIVYPELAFDGDENDRNFQEWFVTTSEFKKVLENVYKKNFILVSYKDLYKEINKDGKTVTVRTDLKLPKGKKPLIISVDDLNANKYMLGNGIAEKIVFDDNGELTGWVKTPEGKYIKNRDSEIIPVLDDFVKAHPDFSFNGAKGVLALTGFEGILGYRTQVDSPNRATEIEEVKKVVTKLKETGWEFASHSYGHPNMQKLSVNAIKEDTNAWLDEVSTLIGPTNIYIYPYGAMLDPGSAGLAVLQNKKFTIFAGVGPTSYEKVYKTENLVMTDRRHVDGMTLKGQRDRFLDLYDSNTIIDRQGRGLGN